MFGIVADAEHHKSICALSKDCAGLVEHMARVGRQAASQRVADLAFRKPVRLDSELRAVVERQIEHGLRAQMLGEPQAACNGAVARAVDPDMFRPNARASLRGRRGRRSGAGSAIVAAARQRERHGPRASTEATFAGRKFIFGEPMKPATNRLRGRW